MKKLQPTTQKKDYKRIKNDPKKLKALKEVLEMLMKEQRFQLSIFHTCFMASTGAVWNVMSKVIFCLFG